MKTALRFTEKLKDYRGSRPLTIVFLGDSVTHGCFELIATGERSFDTAYRPGKAYHALLRQMFETVFPSVPVNVIDAGISGDSAKGGLERLERDVISYKPDLCVVCFGLNDANSGPEKVDDYTGALRQIFTRLTESGIECVCLLPNMMGTRLLYEDTHPFIREVLTSIIRWQNNGTMDMYMQAARDLCKETGVTLCDCYSKWKRLNELGCDTTRLLANHVNHPSEEMHMMFASSLFETILGL